MIKHIEDEIFTFLQSPDPEVMVLKGTWGTGKTFTWRKLLLEASERSKIKMERYAYVSLFGCDSLSNLKSEIFNQLISTKEIAAGAGIETILSNIAEIGQLKKTAFVSLASKATNFLSKLPITKEYVDDLSQLGWSGMKKALICIDDLERHGANLDLRDILGLISNLKEEKNCKVILLLNNGTLEGDDKVYYESYREKIVDIELSFDPDSNDLLNLVFSSSDPNYETVSRRLRLLNVKNIRTIQKIRRYLDKVDPYLKDLTDNYRESIISSIVLFTALHFSRPRNWPSFEDVLETDTEKFSVVGFVTDEEAAKVQKVSYAWVKEMDILRRQYKWGGSDETDQVLGDLVKNGYLDKSRFESLLELTRKETEKEANWDRVQIFHSRVLEILSDSFNDDLDQLYISMKESIETGILFRPSLGHLNQYVILLRNLNEHEKADELIKHYMDLTSNKPAAFFDFTSADRAFTSAVDPKLDLEITKVFKKVRAKELNRLASTVDRFAKIDEFVQKSDKSQLEPEDIELLANFDVADFINYLKNTKVTRYVHGFIASFLRDSGYYPELDSEFKTIRKKLIEVVRIISSENKFNAYRLQKHMKLIEILEPSNVTGMEDIASKIASG